MTTATTTDRPGRAGSPRRAPAVCLLVLALLGGASACSGPEEAAPAAETASSWSVTAWGTLYEVFPEVGPLVAGEAAVAHTHVTVLDGFEPLADGTVEVLLRRGSSEETFAAAEPDRPGVFPVEVVPAEPGEADLVFRVRSPAGTEEIRGGRVRVGTAEEPGGVTVAPAPRGPTAGGEPIPFLKEEQWRSDFATRWVRRGPFRDAVEGLARVRPPAGGEARITAPVAGVLRAEPWPWPGREVAAGEALFRLVPRPGERDLPELEAEAASLESELSAARARLGRLEELLELEAVARREVEEQRTRVEVLEARLGAARRNLSAGRAVRSGSGGTESVRLAAPFAGEVAAVSASPGAAVEAGDELARLVRTEPVWLEVALEPAAARRLRSDGALSGVVVAADGGGSGGSGRAGDPPPLELGAEEVRLVSVAPEVDRGTGTVRALLEARPAPSRGLRTGDALVLGSTVRAHLLLAEVRDGIVVPASALVDDGGVTVVYLQLSGERFARQPVRVLERRGDSVLVDGLVPGQRLVADGGAAVRRSSLMASGQAHGHVH